MKYNAIIELDPVKEASVVDLLRGSPDHILLLETPTRAVFGERKHNNYGDLDIVKRRLFEVFAQTDVPIRYPGLYNVLTKTLDDIPRVPVRPEIYARWCHKPEGKDGEWVCGNCWHDLEFIDGRTYGMPNFCPNCGANMTKMNPF